MKIDPLDAHDRYQHLVKQDFDIGACCQDLIDKRPFGDHPFYIFAHPRTEDDGANKRMIWQARLLKPKAQTNSMLFRAYPGSDLIDVIWIIPDRAMWPQYTWDKMTQSQVICESIYKFTHNREELEAPGKDDPKPEKVQEILFEFYPHIFKRDSLPEEKKTVWDKAMVKKELEKCQKENELKI